MRKWFPVATGVMLVGLLLAVAYLYTKIGNQQEIARLKDEADELRKLRESVYAQVRVRDSMQLALIGRVIELTASSERLRNTVSNLERTRQTERLAVHAINTEDELQARFQKVYPEVARRFLRTDVASGPTGTRIQFGMVPLWSFESFIIDHNNALAYKGQVDSLHRLDTLQLRTIASKDTMYALEHSNRLHFQSLADTTFKQYMDVNARFREHLAMPHFGVTLPKWPTLIIAAGTGAYIGHRLW